MTLYHINVFLHVLAAVLWLGGMFFLAAVGAPALRKVEHPQLRARLFNAVGRGFRDVGWAAIVVLVVTGLLNLQLRGVLTWDALGSSTFWATPYGTALAWKLALVAAMLLNSAAHDFLLGPRAFRAQGTDHARTLRTWSAWSARINAVLGVLLLYVAVRLARGG